MPTFDFRCATCDHVFEFTRPFGSKTIPQCPNCGKKKTEKLISPPAVHFKGSGWYKTDSGTSKKQQSAPKPVEKRKTETTAAAHPKKVENSDSKTGK